MNSVPSSTDEFLVDSFVALEVEVSTCSVIRLSAKNSGKNYSFTECTDVQTLRVRHNNIVVVYINLE